MDFVDMSVDDKIILIEFGRTIKRLRIAKGLTQEGLADMAGLTHSQISNLENGKLDAYTTTLIKLFWALDANPDEFLPKK